MKQPERFYNDEPNELAWTDPATGLKCLILRQQQLGHLCGYVRPPHKLAKRLRAYGRLRYGTFMGKMRRKLAYEHPMVKRVRVHGGLTYCGSRLDGKGHGHTWIGFDCAHAGDLVPFMHELTKDWQSAHYGSRFSSPDVYRNLAYVKEECTRLAAQIAGHPVLEKEPQPAEDSQRDPYDFTPINCD